MLFENREQAARLLARRLSASYKNKNPLVLIPQAIHGRVIAETPGGELTSVMHNRESPVSLS
jgi:hypothetical protein